MVTEASKQPPPARGPESLSGITGRKVDGELDLVPRLIRIAYTEHLYKRPVEGADYILPAALFYRIHKEGLRK